MTSQSRITITADAGRLLRYMDVAEPLMMASSSAGAIWLIARDYAYWETPPGPDKWPQIAGSLRTTHKGREYYESLCRNPSVTDSVTAWKAEALSGLATKAGKLGTVSVKSEIDRAVIPKPAGPKTPKSPEDIADANERVAAAKRRWAAGLGCSVEDVERYGQEGRIKMCPACDEVGVFDKGQSPCRKCRKDRRG